MLPLCFLMMCMISSISPQSPLISAFSETISPASIAIVGEIQDNYANLRYDITYDNSGSEQDHEIALFIPHQNDLRLTNLTLDLNNTLYVAKIFPEREAQQEYNASIEENKTAVLVISDYSGYYVNVNIKAGISAFLSVYFEGVLTRYQGQYSVEFPLEFPSGLICPFSFDVAIESHFNEIVGYEVEGLSPLQIESIDHGIRLQYTSTGGLLIPDTINIGYRLEEQTSGSQLITYSNGTRDFFTYMLAPELTDETISQPRQFVFVIDTSGSMDGMQISQAKIAFRSMIDDLTENDRFNIVEFNSDARKLWNSTEIATNARKDEAKTWVNNLDAGGSTNFLEGCLQGLSSFVDTEDIHIMLVLSDGEPTAGITDSEAILTQVSEGNSLDVSISSVAFGSGADESLMAQLASENDGYFNYVETDNEAATNLLDFYKSFSTPWIKSYSIEIEGGYDLAHLNSLENTGFQNGSEILLAGCYESPLTINTFLEYETKNSTFINIASTPTTDYPHVELIWAHYKIDFLLEEYATEPTDGLKKEITELAMYYGIVVKGFTAFLIVVEDETIDDTPVGEDEEEDWSSYDGSGDDSSDDGTFSKNEGDSYGIPSSAAIPLPVIPIFACLIASIVFLRSKIKRSL